ncbi:hypothetical protein EMO90_06600, partial [Bifidobacterium vespertilionis]
MLLIAPRTSLSDPPHIGNAVFRWAERKAREGRRRAGRQGRLDGAEIAQADLELRGAGDVLGDAQSGGKSSLKLLRVIKDAKL